MLHINNDLLLTEKPSFGNLGKLKEIRVKAGEKLDIPIPINGHPPPIASWVKDGNPLDKGDRDSIQDVSIQTNKLKISCIFGPLKHRYYFNRQFMYMNESVIVSPVVVMPCPLHPLALHYTSVNSKSLYQMASIFDKSWRLNERVLGDKMAPL